MWNWMSAAGSPPRVRWKATTSATVEVSGPERRSSHSARNRGCSATNRVSVSETSQMTVTNGWSWRLAPTPGSGVADVDPDGAQLRRVSDPRELEQLRGADGAGAEHDLALSADHFVAAAPGPEAHADGARALELHAQHRGARAHLEVGALRARAAGTRRRWRTAGRVTG